MTVDMMNLTVVHDQLDSSNRQERHLLIHTVSNYISSSPESPFKMKILPSIRQKLSNLDDNSPIENRLKELIQRRVVFSSNMK